MKNHADPDTQASHRAAAAADRVPGRRSRAQAPGDPREAVQRQRIQAAFGFPVQRVGEEDEPLQGQFDMAQRVEEESLQARFEARGLPAGLAAGDERLSGVSMAGVQGAMRGGLRTPSYAGESGQLGKHSGMHGSVRQQRTFLEKHGSRHALALKQNMNDVSEVAQLFSYRSKNPANGVSMSVRVQVGDARISIIDATPKTRKVGTLGGFIDYKIEKTDQGPELILEHFEAHPPGAGLGTILMFELSLVAIGKGIPTIAVATPALSAMGAYKSFGGKPRDKDRHEEHKLMYLEAMRSDANVHKRMVNEESDAFAEGEVSKAKYFDPELGPVGAGNVFSGAKKEYTNAHSGEGDYERASGLKALSADLIYVSYELQKKTLLSIEKNWDIT